MSEVTVSDHTARLFEERAAATAARIKWEKYEKDLTAKIHEALGYGDEEKSESRVAVDAAGVPLFKVDVTPRKSLDKKRLASHYPAALADCEVTTYVKTIKPVKQD